VPVLFVSSQFDRIAAPAASEAAAPLFPNGRGLRVPGATHYFLYDRPDVTAELIEAFFENPEAIRQPDRASSEVAKEAHTGRAKPG